MEEMRVLVRKSEPEWETPLARTRHRWDDNMKINVEDILYEAVAQDRDQCRALVKTIEPSGSTKGGVFLD
jgi:hypothetical protein